MSEKAQILFDWLRVPTKGGSQQTGEHGTSLSESAKAQVTFDWLRVPTNGGSEQTVFTAEDRAKAQRLVFNSIVPIKGEVLCGTR